MLNFYKAKEIKNNSWFKVIDFAVWRMLEELEDSEKRTIDKAYKNKIIAMTACELTNQGEFDIGKKWIIYTNAYS